MIKKWGKPKEESVRKLAKAFKIPGAKTRPIDDIRKAVNHELLRSFYGDCYKKEYK